MPESQSQRASTVNSPDEGRSWLAALLGSPRVRAFLILGGAMLIYSLSHRGRELFYDSRDYWALAASFRGDDGAWSFENYSTTFRPYFFPFLLSLVQRVAATISVDGVLLFRVFSALFFGWSFGVFVPAFAERLGGCRVGLGRTLLLGGLVFLFWRGMFLYPLSDFPALMMWAGAVYLVLPKHAGARQGWWWFILAGALVAGALLARPAYQVGLVLPLFVIARRVVYGSGLGWRTPARVALLAVGFSAVALPQASINERLTGRFSIFAPEQDLFLKQLQWGLLLQRYETNVGDALPFPNVGFVDPVGLSVLGENGFERLAQIDSYSVYAGIVAQSPTQFASVYARRVYSGMDVWFPTVYVEGDFKRSRLLASVSYTLWFVAGWMLFRWMLRSRAVSFDQLCVIGMLCLPVGPAIPSAVEPRFFLPIHLLLYAIVCFGVVLPSTNEVRSRKTAAGLLGFALFAIACNTASSWIHASMHNGRAHAFLRSAHPLPPGIEAPEPSD